MVSLKIERRNPKITRQQVPKAHHTAIHSDGTVESHVRNYKSGKSSDMLTDTLNPRGSRRGDCLELESDRQSRFTSDPRSIEVIPRFANATSYDTESRKLHRKWLQWRPLSSGCCPIVLADYRSGFDVPVVRYLGATGMLIRRLS